ncbi:MAG: S8/S53 family peptidase [Gemmataceae bacterium]|nr:S8/S53 family peptidase [Gemmataceae bacterium]
MAAIAILGLARNGQAPAQPATPPPPAHYQVVLRYRIVAPRDQHAILYDRLVKHLQGLKFEFQPPLDERPETDRIDPSKNEFRGRLAAAQAPRLRDNLSVAGVLLVPDGFKLPDAADQPVRVRLELAGNLEVDRQRELAEQTKLLLGLLGFKEAGHYDHRGAGGRPYTKLMGTVPRGQLEVLLKDLRTQPGGWLAPQIAPAELPLPLQNVNPILVTEVLTDPEPIQDAAEPAARSPAFLEKIGPGLWELVNDKAKDQQFVRLQVLFAGTPAPDQLRQLVESVAPGAVVEGVLGTYVTAQVLVAHVKALAALPEVLEVRLPTPAAGPVAPATPGVNEPAKVLQQSGLAEWHQRGKRGQGMRLAILDTDFRGWENLVKQGKLPPATRLVDLTTQYSQDLFPAPQPAGAELGHGTQCALAAAVAAPAADMVLIRVPGDDPLQLDEVARYARGGVLSATLDRRLDELRTASSLLNLQRSRLLKERQAILDDFRDEEDLRFTFDFLGPVYGWIFSERDWHRQRMEHQARLEKELAAKERRYWDHVALMQSLKGIPLIASALTWNDGYSLGGASPLSRALDAHAAGPMWFVPAGNTAGQAWTGMFRDSDGNGLMEFVAPGEKLPAGCWTSELNFFAWQPHGGKQIADLPAQTGLRVTLQWREPHDPDYYRRPGEEDWYRRSLAGLTLTLLRQRDPGGKTLGADAFEIVARSNPIPARLDHQPHGTVYEQRLDFTVPKPGRYALRVEQPTTRWLLSNVEDRYVFELAAGETTTSIRPLGAPTLPGIEAKWELRPRLFVDGAGPLRLQGRPQLADFATTQGAVGMPGDARSVISVGAWGLDGRKQPFSAAGPPPFIGLASKPTIWAYDAVRHGQGGAWGTSLSASFAAGTAATLFSAGITADELRELIRLDDDASPAGKSIPPRR